MCVRYVDIVINVTADIKVSKYLSSIEFNPLELSVSRKYTDTGTFILCC